MNSCKDSPTQNEIYKFYKQTYDYEYLVDKYFFIDMYYRDHFESSFSEDLSQIKYDPLKKITKLNVFISTHISDVEARECIASINPSEFINIDYDDVVINSENYDKLYKGTFKPLYEDEFDYNPLSGYFWLNREIDDLDVLGISYELNCGDKIGTLIEDISEKTIVLKLIKASGQNPQDSIYSSTWPLMMKNVYEFEDYIQSINSYNLIISNLQGDESFSSNGEQVSYSYCYGFDVLDEQGRITKNGDGQFDFNPLIYNSITGTIIFPFLQPFQIIYGFNAQLAPEIKSDIYDTKDLIKKGQHSNFKIVIKIKE